MTPPHSLDLLDGDFYVQDPYPTFAWYREHQPVAWDATNELWGVFRYDDIVEVEENPRAFISSDTAKGGSRPNIPADPSFINTDEPVHGRRRRLVSNRFTPRAVQRWESHIRDVVVELIDSALERGTVDVVADLAAPLPARMIGWLLGFPEESWRELRHWSETTIPLGGGPRYHTPEGYAAAMEFMQQALGLFAARKQCPVDDVMSVWARATSDGEPISEREVASDCLLLLDGGAETTRTVIARALIMLATHNDQWQQLRSGADVDCAVEEFIRYVTPIHNMCRVAARPYDLGGVTIQPGQQVVLMYASANRDPSHFDRPNEFDITRRPNHHLSFGLGSHFCLGAGLARLEIRVFFEELVRRAGAVHLVPDQPVVEMPNAFVHGVKSGGIRLVHA